jgi:uncharacterized protein (TIGR02246 family)
MSTAGSRVAAAVLLALAPVCAARAQTARSDSAAISAIQELARSFSAAFVRGDAEAMTALYTEDAVIFPERSEPIAGVAAIRRYWTPRPGRRVTRHVLTPTQVVVDGDHAYDHGVYEIAGESDGVAWGPSHGSYVVVWRREPPGWRMKLDIWNSRPPAKP